MKVIIRLFLLFSIVACADKTQNAKFNTVDTVHEENRKEENVYNVSTSYGFDTSYDLSNTHNPFLVTGFFNADDTLDTAMIIRNKATGKDALFLKHGGTNETYFIKTGKDVEHNFENLNWVREFKVIQKGTKIFDDVIDGEIVGEDQVPESKKVLLKTDAIFMHEDEGGGGGVIYFKNGKYVWVQQD
jgi:hypothetical protein